MCENARRVGGKEIKTRSQSVIDGKILIDFPSDTYLHALYHGLDLPNIRTCLITHSHFDHLYLKDLWCRNKGIAYGIEGTTMDIYAYTSGYEQVKAYAEAAVTDNRVSAHLVTPISRLRSKGIPSPRCTPAMPSPPRRSFI